MKRKREEEEEEEDEEIERNRVGKRGVGWRGERVKERKSVCERDRDR